MCDELDVTTMMSTMMMGAMSLKMRKGLAFSAVMVVVVVVRKEGGGIRPNRGPPSSLDGPKRRFLREALRG